MLFTFQTYASAVQMYLLCLPKYETMSNSSGQFVHNRIVSSRNNMGQSACIPRVEMRSLDADQNMISPSSTSAHAREEYSYVCQTPSQAFLRAQELLKAQERKGQASMDNSHEYEYVEGKANLAGEMYDCIDSDIAQNGAASLPRPETRGHISHKKLGNVRMLDSHIKPRAFIGAGEMMGGCENPMYQDAEVVQSEKETAHVFHPENQDPEHILKTVGSSKPKPDVSVTIMENTMYQT